MRYQDYCFDDMTFTATKSGTVTAIRLVDCDGKVIAETEVLTVKEMAIESIKAQPWF